MEKAIDLNDLRIKLDQLNEQIISGLKTRSRYALNSRTFSEEFAEGKTWFLYRLKREQDVDSEFGRFLFHDQTPLLFTKKELSGARIGREVSRSGIEPIVLNFSKEIIQTYQEILKEICETREDEATYGEVAKLDVNNVLALNERVVGLGEQVAAYKLQEHPELLKAKSEKDILAILVNTKREEEVVVNTVEIAKKYGLKNLESISEFAKKIIEITRKVEVKFILHAQKNMKK